MSNDIMAKDCDWWCDYVLLPKREWTITRYDEYVIAGVFVSPFQYKGYDVIHKVKIPLSEFPNSLVTESDLADHGIFLNTG